MEYTDRKIEDLTKILYNGIALIVTATETETSAMHNAMKPIANHDKLFQIHEGANTYYLGMFGKYIVAHVQCGMGSSGRESSIITIGDAINALKPRFVIMIGIAFGVDEEKQKIGDVLISEGIIPYNCKRIGDSITIHRGQNAPSSKTLLSRFKSIKTWEFLLDDGRKASKIPTQILSGEELIDNKRHRDALATQFPNAKGGEMEGAGVFAACDEKAPWILIKGICDFADGNKKNNKAQNQNMAIRSALSLCMELFNSNPTSAG